MLTRFINSGDAMWEKVVGERDVFKKRIIGLLVLAALSLAAVISFNSTGLGDAINKAKRQNASSSSSGYANSLGIVGDGSREP